MKVFMLGWEFPPFISGGLGTACYGLTKAMSEIGTEVQFVLPRLQLIAGYLNRKLRPSNPIAVLPYTSPRRTVHAVISFASNPLQRPGHVCHEVP